MLVQDLLTQGPEPVRKEPWAPRVEGRWLRANRFELTWAGMYEKPPLFPIALVRLGEVFGTDSINEASYAIGGCESCDWGSSYGYEFTIEDPTRNLDILDAIGGEFTK
jgi:hypothetical protein